MFAAESPRGARAPAATTTASKSSSLAVTLGSLTSALSSNTMPSSRMSATRRSTTDFSSFMLGMPYMSRPPGRSSRSNTVTRAPRRASSHAATRPAGPEPTTATVGTPSPAGSKRCGPPLAHSWSLIARSLSWIVVGWPSTEPRLHAASHSAGHTRLVNSGMGEVSDRRSAASSQRPRYTSSFHSGIRLCSGQPLGRALPKLAPI